MISEQFDVARKVSPEKFPALIVEISGVVFAPSLINMRQSPAGLADHPAHFIKILLQRFEANEVINHQPAAVVIESAVLRPGQMTIVLSSLRQIREHLTLFLRLGFAIAAHLDPDILLLDEVLTTADASFQKKCLDRIKRASEAGTAVLFVSHNLKSVTHLCHRAIHFHAGEIYKQGKPEQVVADYLKEFAA